MNTRLQVEHGITELCYGVDLVELMLNQADAELTGVGGLKASHVASLQPKEPNGAAIEARVYAENPAKDYAPAPGVLQIVEWKISEHARIDTWVHTGTIVSSSYDPLLAKVMVHTPSRDESITAIHEVLSQTRICGPPTNLDFLASIVGDDVFRKGVTMTNFLANFNYSPAAIDVISGGAYTTVQDYPGRPTMGRGFPHAGPMDPLAFQVANLLVGNNRGKEGLECTLDGPELLFLGGAIIAVCGAPMEVTVDGTPVAMWSRIFLKKGQRLKIGKTKGGGCRSYLAIHGGLPSVAEWFGSKATSPGVGVGGYQGRALAAGDLLALAKDTSEYFIDQRAIPEHLIPEYPSHWDIMALVGPYQEGYLTDEDVKMIYDTKWSISHNAARGGIRLVGPKPNWARTDGGEGGAHPSNVPEYGYPVGALNWTGDDGCVFPIDCPDFGGFVSSTTIIKADYWRLGQMKAGDTMQYKRISLEDALEVRRKVNHFIDGIAWGCMGRSFEGVKPLDYSILPPSASEKEHGTAIVHRIEAEGNRPVTMYRQVKFPYPVSAFEIDRALADKGQGGDDYLLVEYGEGNFDLNHRCRVTALTKALKESQGAISPRKSQCGDDIPDGLINTVGCCTCQLTHPPP